MYSCKNCFSCLMYSKENALCYIDQKWHNHKDANECENFALEDKEYDETIAEMAEFFEMESNNE